MVNGERLKVELNWRIKELTAEEQAAAERLSAELDISPVAGRILAGRGLRTAAEARAYIRPSLDSLHDPFLMRDMTAAVDRLCRAIDNGERIMVYGDYDVDGTTAVALMYSFLRTQTDNLIYASLPKVLTPPKRKAVRSSSPLTAVSKRLIKSTMPIVWVSTLSSATTIRPERPFQEPSRCSI